MALTSSSTLSDALSQYNDNLRWWESETKATNLLEAVYFMLAQKPATLATAGCSATFADLQDLKAKLEAKVLNTASTAQRASFVRGRALRL